MDITKILDYQKLDTELFKLEKAIRDNNHRKTANEMLKRANDAQTRSVQLENNAKELVERINKIKEQFEVQNKMLNQVLVKDVDNMDEKEVENMLVLKDKLMHNSNILDKSLSQLAEKVKLVIDEYQKVGKIYSDARNKYSVSKASYDKELAEIEPKKKELESSLKSQEKGLEKDALEKYKKLRQDNIFPVFVPLREHSCGGCNMELPIATISKIKESGSIQCEHCHRIIYFK